VPHRGVRSRQVQPGAGHPVRRGAAPLRRELQPLCPPVPRAAGAAPHGGPGAGGRWRSGGSASAGEELALHGGHPGGRGGVPVRALHPRGPAGVLRLRGGGGVEGCAPSRRGHPGPCPRRAGHSHLARARAGHRRLPRHARAAAEGRLHPAAGAGRGARAAGAAPQRGRGRHRYRLGGGGPGEAGALPALAGGGGPGAGVGALGR
jgi:hypothetical protein